MFLSSDAAKTNPIQTQFQTQSNPIKPNFKAKQTQFQTFYGRSHTQKIIVFNRVNAKCQLI